ncbi:hypothetical protein GQ42DRAFT_157807 [Ramicandelaber brevisporus]|nr:hypothetical protein GQ42DRAFT_157807 [Ramicandelaber brevisporus]
MRQNTGGRVWNTWLQWRSPRVGDSILSSDTVDRCNQFHDGTTESTMGEEQQQQQQQHVLSISAPLALLSTELSSTLTSEDKDEVDVSLFLPCPLGEMDARDKHQSQATALLTATASTATPIGPSISAPVASTAKPDVDWKPSKSHSISDIDRSEILTHGGPGRSMMSNISHLDAIHVAIVTDLEAADAVLAPFPPRKRSSGSIKLPVSVQLSAEAANSTEKCNGMDSRQLSAIQLRVLCAISFIMDWLPTTTRLLEHTETTHTGEGSDDSTALSDAKTFFAAIANRLYTAFTAYSDDETSTRSSSRMSTGNRAPVTESVCVRRSSGTKAMLALGRLSGIRSMVKRTMSLSIGSDTDSTHTAEELVMPSRLYQVARRIVAHEYPLFEDEGFQPLVESNSSRVSSDTLYRYRLREVLEQPSGPACIFASYGALLAIRKSGIRPPRLCSRLADCLIASVERLERAEAIAQNDAQLRSLYEGQLSILPSCLIPPQLIELSDP